MLLKTVSKSNVLKLLLRKSFIYKNECRIERSSKMFSTSISHSEKSYAEHLESIQREGVRFGQPTHFSHPHLLKQNELATGVLPTEFASRRRRLMEKIQENCHMNNQTHRNIVIIPGAVKKYMTGKIPYFFRQNSDFYYLTGCLEPDSILVICSENEDDMKSVLFMRKKDAHAELWDGPRTGVKQSVRFFGVDEAYPLENISEFCEKFISGKETTNYWYDDSDDHPILMNKLRTISSAQFRSPISFIHELRVIKSLAEANLMRKTCEIASNAVNQTMKESRPFDSEHHIYARVDYHCRMNDASFLAYPPVVAAGNNANTIHYIDNTQVVKNNELVLMDAGCEYGVYSSDITRTWPINGKFTSAQEILYEVVHTIQMELMHIVTTADNITLDQLFEIMCLRLGKYSQEIGLVNKSLEPENAATVAMMKFCPHHVSHYLGMDVHDTPTIGRDRNLEPGMVFTVEPGIYVAANCADVPSEFRGIGIRIEDDVLYTEKGIEVLTKNCIKDKAELEKLISS